MRGVLFYPLNQFITENNTFLKDFIEDFIQSFNFCPKPCFETSLKSGAIILLSYPKT